MPSTRLPLHLARRPGPATAPLALLAMAAVLAAGACGQGSATTTPAGTTGATTARPGGAASASGLTRTGGVAGFADDLAVAADGHVTGTTRSAPVDCHVPATTAVTLATAPAPDVPPAAGADRMTVTLQRAEGTVDLGEAQGSDPLSSAARQLLDDVQLPPGQRALCR